MVVDGGSITFQVCARDLSHRAHYCHRNTPNPLQKGRENDESSGWAMYVL